jgi:hypothetical protein
MLTIEEAERLLRRLGRRVAAGPYPMIENRNGTAKDRHKHQDGDQLQYGVPIDIHEHVHATIVVAAGRLLKRLRRLRTGRGKNSADAVPIIGRGPPEDPGCLASDGRIPPHGS